jgi:RES domain-containing protein
MTSLGDELNRAVGALPIRRITGLYYRQTSPRRQPLELPAMARQASRWAAKGDPALAFSADSELAAMLEQTRHFELRPGEEPALPVRRISELHVHGLPAIDLINPLALDLLRLKIDDMRFETQPFCRALASAAWAAHPAACALLVPSTPLAGAQVLVVRQSGFDAITVGDQRLVQLAPQTVLDDERRA